MSKVDFIISSTVKSMVRASILALALLSFVTPSSTAAQTGGSVADGSIRYSINLLREKASTAKFEQRSHQLCPSIANSAASPNNFSL